MKYDSQRKTFLKRMKRQHSIEHKYFSHFYFVHFVFDLTRRVCVCARAFLSSSIFIFLLRVRY